MSKKRTMQIDVIEEVKGTQFMQCKLYIDGNASVILMNKIDYERLLSDSFFVRDGKNRNTAKDAYHPFPTFLQVVSESQSTYILREYILSQLLFDICSYRINFKY